MASARFSALFLLALPLALAGGCSDDPAGSPGDAGTDSSVVAPPEDASAPPKPDSGPAVDGATDSAAPGAAPKHAYVMTTFKMWVFDLATPDAHTEIGPGLGSGFATYGTDGNYEPFDISPDGKRIAILRDGVLHLAELSNLAGGVTVPADTWARAPRFSDDGTKVRYVRRLRQGGGRFDDVAIVEVPFAGGTPTVVRALPSAAFHTDLDRYAWKWDGSLLTGPERLEGRPDNTSKAHGMVTIDATTGVAVLVTRSYGAGFFTFAQNREEPTCVGNLCVTVHDGTTGENNGSFTAESSGFLPDGRVYFTSNRDQYVKGGASSGARVTLSSAATGADYETLVPHTGDRPIAYTRDGKHYAAFDGVGATAKVAVRAAAGGATIATLTGFNAANVPTAVRFGP